MIMIAKLWCNYHFTHTSYSSNMKCYNHKPTTTIVVYVLNGLYIR